jgi:Asp-tRNA(Asn)/Glu-tRNA(Gln) amidotransferase C subunit
VTGLEDVFREDVVHSASDDVRKEIIAQFPAKTGDLLRVRAVFADKSL